jgi:hypothetical protein
MSFIDLFLFAEDLLAEREPVLKIKLYLKGYTFTFIKKLLVVVVGRELPIR